MREGDAYEVGDGVFMIKCMVEICDTSIAVVVEDYDGEWVG